MQPGVNCTCYFAWVWNPVSDVSGRTQIEGVRGRGAEENILHLRGDDVTNGLRKLHNDELHNLYSYPNVIMILKSKEIDGACSSNGGY